MSNEEFIKELNQGDLDLLENDLKTLFSGKIDPKDEAEILSNPDQKERILGWWDAARISGIKDKLLGKEQELAGLKQVVDNYLRNKKQTTTLPPEQAKSRVEFLKRVLTNSPHPSVLELPEMVDILVKLNLSENDAIDLIKETFGKELGIEDLELASYLKEIRSIDQYVDRQTFDKNQKLDLKMFIKNNVLPSVIKAKTVVKDANSKQIAEVIARVTAPNNFASDAVYRTIINYPYKDFYEQSVQTMFLDKHSNNSQITALFQRVSDYGIGKVKDKVTSAVVQKFVASEVGGQILKSLGIKIATAAATAPETGGLSLTLAAASITQDVGKNILSWIKIKTKEFAPVAGMIIGATLGSIIAFVIQGPTLVMAAAGGSIGYVLGNAGEVGESLARGVNTLSTGLVEAVGTEIVWPIVAIIIATPIVIALILFIITNSALVVPYDANSFPFGYNSFLPGVSFDCKDSGNRIVALGATEKLLPDDVESRKKGLCITPTEIVIHWSGGWNGVMGTYNEFASAKNKSCQFATDENTTLQMLQMWEKKVEFSWCAGSHNDFAVNIEMSGLCFSEMPGTCGGINTPPPESEIEKTVSLVCWLKKQYNINTVIGHYEIAGSGKSDPGSAFLHNTLLPRVNRACP